MNIGAWVKGHKPEAILGGGGIAVTLFLAMRARSKSAASSTSAAPAYPASSVLPVSTGNTTATDAFSGIEDQVIGLQSALLALQNPQPAAAAAAPPTSSAPAAAATAPGYGIVDTAQGSMVWLGVTGPGGSTSGDYQVGGGEPVYFGNAQQLAQGGTQQQGIDVYTPVGGSGLVSAKPG